MKLFNFFIGLLEPIVKLFSKYGVVKTLGYTFILGIMCFFGYTCYCVINLDSRIDASVTRALTEQSEVSTQTHSEGLEKRMASLETINSLLKETMYDVDADRACVLEMHNGTNNTAGLPFLYAEMTYEQVRSGVQHCDENYAKINLTRYTFPYYLSDASYFRGSVEADGMQIDDKMAQKVLNEGTKYIIVYELYGKKNAIGYFVVCWNKTDNPPLTEEDLTRISVAAQKLSTLLDID